jgi:hypothetical protein
VRELRGIWGWVSECVSESCGGCGRMVGGVVRCQRDGLVSLMLSTCEIEEER